MTAERWIVEDHRTGPNPVETPDRRRGSIRRTTSLEMDFPHGRDRPARIIGHGRDLLTRSSGETSILAEDRLEAIFGMDRIIRQLEIEPGIPGSEALVDNSAIAGHRKRSQAILDRARASDRPVVQLLDDFVGAGIILEWIWTRIEEDIELLGRTIGDQTKLVGSCHAFAPGSSAFDSDDYLRRLYLVPPLQRDDDPDGFHFLEPDRERTQRRARRIDAWRESASEIRVDAMFQDSGVIAGGQRIAIHEYRVRARIDAAGMRLAGVEAVGGMLPHAACRSAPLSLAQLIGLPVSDLGIEVAQRLRGTAGCTHLNDAIRALSAVPALLGQLG